MSRNSATARDRLLLQLERQRAEIDGVLSNKQPAQEREPPQLGNAFPRSYTMRLLMNQPMFTTAAPGSAQGLFGYRSIGIWRTLMLGFRILVSLRLQKNSASHPGARS